MYHLFRLEKLEGFPELGVITEQAEGEADRDDRLCLPQTPGDVPDAAPIIPLPSPDLHHQRQVLEAFCSPTVYVCLKYVELKLLNFNIRSDHP